VQFYENEDVNKRERRFLAKQIILLARQIISRKIRDNSSEYPGKLRITSQDIYKILVVQGWEHPRTSQKESWKYRQIDQI
jgi:hypothetical protein